MPKPSVPSPITISPWSAFSRLMNSRQWSPNSGSFSGFTVKARLRGSIFHRAIMFRKNTATATPEMTLMSCAS